MPELLLSEAYFGRAAELAVLETAWRHAKSGGVAWVSIRAGAGAGKSRLVREFWRSRGDAMLPMAGKCGALHRERPYQAVVQALTRAARELASMEQDALALVLDRLRDVLGGSAGLLTEVIPALGPYLSTEAAPTFDDSGAARHQFTFAVRSFLRALATPRRPVLLFMDDLQWVDVASVELLASLAADRELHNLLVVGCFRGEEIGPDHPLESLLDELRDQRTWLEAHEIGLAPLEQGDVEGVVADSLGPDFKQGPALSAYIVERSGGNPLHCRELLSSMEIQGHLVGVGGAWDWQPPATSGIYATDHVSELVQLRVAQMSADVQRLLKLAACLGATFDPEDLAIVSELSVEHIRAGLDAALAAMLIEAEEDRFRFVHDTVQEAIAELASEASMRADRAAIGWALYDGLSPEAREPRTFELVHLLSCADVSELSEARKGALASLALTAGQSAANTTAYQDAIFYAQLARELLTELDSAKADALFSARLAEGQARYHCGDRSEALEVATLLLADACGARELRRAYLLYKNIVASSGADFGRAVEAGLDVLRRIDAGPVTDLQAQINAEYNALQAFGVIGTPRELLDYRAADDPLVEERVAFLADLYEAAYYAGEPLVANLCVVRMTRESLQHGISPSAALGFGIFGLTLLERGEVRQAFAFGEVALKLCERFDRPALFTKVTNLYCHFLVFIARPFSDAVPLYDEVARVGREIGDLLFGLWAAVFAVWTRLIAGTPLREVYARSQELLPFVEETRDEKILHVFDHLRRTVQRLYGGGLQKYADHEALDEAARACWDAQGFLPGRAWQSILDAQRLYVEGRHQLAYDKLCDETLAADLQTVLFPVTQRVIYRGASAAALLEACVPGERPEIAAQLDQDAMTLAHWASTNPNTFRPWVLVLEAASMVHQGKAWQAAQLYEQARLAALCSSSDDEQTVHHLLAAIHEHTARFSTNVGQSFAAEAHLEAAQAHYRAWGAVGRAEQLRAGKAARRPTAVLDLDTTSKGLEQLIGVTEALADESSSERLIGATLESLLTITGADRGVLARVDSGEPVIVSEALARRPAATGFAAPLAGFVELPAGLVRSVARTGVEVRLTDAASDERYLGDAYLESASVRSVLCGAARHQGQVVAIFYLESAAPDAFGSNVGGLLRALLGQATVSLANTRLHESLLAETTEHAEAVEALRVSEARMRRGHVFAQMGVWEIDLGAREVLWSDHIGPMFGLEPGERRLSYERCMGFIDEAARDSVKEAVRDCAAGGDLDETFVVNAETGERRWMRISGRLSSTAEDTATLIGVIHDITDRVEAREEREKLQRQLNYAQRMEAIGQLTGGIAHDFNNMLAAIVGNAELASLTAQSLGSRALDKEVGEIIRASQRASELVSKLLAFSRGGEIVATRPVALGNLVLESTGMLRATLPSTVACETNVPDEAPAVLITSVDLHQIVMNSGINARDAMDGRGRLEVGVRLHESLEARCSSCQLLFSGELTEVYVTDTGEGMDEAKVGRIFEPFFTSKPVSKGTGMGLAVVHGVVHKAGGHIVVESEVGVGTTFRYLFPRVELGAEDEPVDASRASARRVHLRGRVLVVDDEPSIRRMFADLLEHAGLDVEVAPDARAALARFDESPERFDLVLTDQTMPGMTGTELVAELLCVRADLPIILCSGYTPDVTQSNYRDFGFRSFLLKPVSRATLIDGVEQILGAKQR